MALDTLTQEQTRNPGSKIDRKIENAAAHVVEAHAAKAATALAQGEMLVAGSHWAKAYEHCAPRVAEETCEQVRASIRQHSSALELSADDAAKKGKYEQAGEVYEAILLVMPEHVAVAEKNHTVHRSLAVSLQGRADKLEKNKLLGAAWAMNVRALHHDPMQPKAFASGSSIERALRSRAKVAVQDVVVDARKSDRAFANVVASTIRPRLDDVKPYGPTKDPAAVKATLTMTIVGITHGDVTVEGIEHMRNASTKKVPNPRITVQKATVAEKKAALAKLQKTKNPGPKTQQKLAAAKKDLEAAKKTLAALPATVKPPATWDLPYREVTRNVEAVVRFELKESDHAEPVVLELTRRIDRTDRTHAGSAARKVAADPLKLPSSEALLAELADRFGDGAEVLVAARERRIETRLQKAKAHLAAGRTDQALHAYVEVVFFAGVEALPADAAAYLARAMESDEVETLLASR